MFKTLVVALDLEADGDRALGVVQALARMGPVRVDLVTVSSPGMPTAPDSYELERRARQFGWDGDSWSIVHDVDAASALVQHAAQRNDALLVMATSARRPWSSTMFGSVPGEVLRTTDRPVLLIGPNVRADVPAAVHDVGAVHRHERRRRACGAGDRRLAADVQLARAAARRDPPGRRRPHGGGATTERDGRSSRRPTRPPGPAGRPRRRPGRWAGATDERRPRSGVRGHECPLHRRPPALAQHDPAADPPCHLSRARRAGPPDPAQPARRPGTEHGARAVPRHVLAGRRARRHSRPRSKEVP